MPNKSVTTQHSYKSQPPMSREARSSDLPASHQSAQVKARSDDHPNFGHEDIARLCVGYMEDVFEFRELKLPPNIPLKHVNLLGFINTVIDRAELGHPSAVNRLQTPFAAILVLQRLKHANNKYVTNGPKAAAGLFVTAYILAYKIIIASPHKLCLGHWVTIGQNVCDADRLKTYEREMMDLLGNDLHAYIAKNLDQFVELYVKSCYGGERSSKTRSSKSSSEVPVVGLGFGNAGKLPGSSVNSMMKPVAEQHHISPMRTVHQHHVDSPALSTNSSRTKGNIYATGGVYVGKIANTLPGTYTHYTHILTDQPWQSALSEHDMIS